MRSTIQYALALLIASPAYAAPATQPAPPPPAASLTEADTPGATRVAFVVINNGSLPVVAVNVGMGAKKENKLAAPIPVRGSAAIAELDPVEYTCMDIAKSNDRADHLCLGLEAGKTYTYTVSDATGEHPNLTIINRGSLAIVAVELGQGPSSQNLLASPIPPGGQATISTIPSGGGLQLVLMSRSNGMATAWAMTLAPGETCTYVMRDEKKKQKKKKKN